MRRVLLILGLEAYAALLAFLQALGGVRTDEAKYLLNIPYPHPPAVRWILSQLDALPFQEMLVRILFATLMVQAVWVLWDMARDFPRPKRFLLAGLWLFSGGVLLQAGTVMMAPLTALEALIFLWMLQKKIPSVWVGFFWLFSLFTAYQAVLFFPLVFACLRQHCSIRRSMYYLLVPVVLLALYTFTNPLILSSVVTHSNRDLESSLLDRLLATGRLWTVGGSAILSMLGTWGILRSRRWELVASFLLVAAYIAFSRYDYYAVLFLPLFIGGVLAWPKLLLSPRMATVLTAIIGIHLAYSLFTNQHLSSARTTVQLLDGMNVQGALLIEGSFGHEWQYESPWEIRRFSEHLLEDAGVVVCLQTCPEWDKRTWRVILFEPEVWVRSKWLS
ncbi:hypothetical protein A2454_02935 [Candidatus Peribacteria bacterium RIFOXYC2_FULL_55_14]|nr:MAG: hypothetical protein UY85_C0037G0004 [Candidatus Peribacteria bacterium GW2011_GWB1_54_5]KKW38972.1 MAG: hypothetical protein UY87_C0057G0012 [Candidatus Peribacteria bacterium GW2011_GWC2_54_8]KKW41544.1 MAG: hypothetical protein UY90_C0050G0014 [Candidatus Peregrinibacteria bacterium GW2011_GWA2_54_9]OGJ71128.1 MAG: hypothetical protein A2198_01315 [Candidatus Peribacteria bacterium RIFOXYA1_FULL_56_14]OGJ73762.1 MAG: hypothetical protein A2384_04260 [Candidatus Peribacteria bacterium